ncbi:MAG: hypothetical protein BMS9Abin23_0007 [Thermodesulfobacteriota bacterium]|nr:MAG: hypothetical protein BMS9Abin23_0007 [Thermodesulfobacteriota bacterium]
MKRRDFLKYIGAGGLGTALGIFFGKKSAPPGANLIPYLIPPEDLIPGVASWFSSLCTQCDAGCGTIVRVMEGRAKKIEGNPKHPVNKGKLCARGQASLQALYNPDRIQGPMKRTGERGSGKFKEISWDEALKTVARQIGDIKEKDGGQGLFVLSSSLGGHLGKLIGDFTRASGSSNYLQYELFQQRNLQFANKASMGIQAIPHYDIGNTKYLLSFGADFSSTWISPVNYSYGYGEMRQSDPRRRGRLVQVEPRMSLTGANADEWVPAKPGTEGVLALAIAYAIVEEGYYKGSDSARWKAALKKFNPGAASKITEVEKKRIYHIAEEFAGTRPSLALAGETLSSYENGVSGVVAVNILNHLAGNLGAKGGVRPNPEDFHTLKATGGLDFKKSIRTLAEKASSGKVKALLVYNTNPVFTTPAEVGLNGSLDKIPFIASLASFMDETTAMADIILPVHTSLEDWGDDIASPSVGVPVATLMQPVVSPYYDTRGAGDIFLSLAGRLRNEAERTEVKGLYKDFFTPSLTAKNFQEYLKGAWRDFYRKDKTAAASSLTFEGFWNGLLRDGGWWPTKRHSRKKMALTVGKVKGLLPAGQAPFKGDENEYPFYLLPYAQAGYYDGRGANLPWLQELADPMTSVVWGSWVEINPATAKKLGIKEGELLSVESPYGQIKVPAYLYAGIRPDTVAVPIGQGHSIYGRYAKDRGANPIEILPAVWDRDSGAMALNVTRVSIKKTSGAADLVKLGASTNDYGRPIAQTITPHEYQKIKKEKV